LASLYLSVFFPEAEFVCFEPSSETYQVLVRNLTVNGLRFRALQKAVTDADGWVCFETGRSSMERAVLEEGSLIGSEPGLERVPSVALGEELKRLGVRQIDFLKFDVEGAEVQLLDGLGAMASSVHEVVGETHGQDRADEVRRRLATWGFAIVKDGDGHIAALRREC
jgi:FkbM family methyltransferase